MEKRTEDAIIRLLENIARSLRVISGREDNVRAPEQPKKTYADRYFAKSE